MNHEPLHPTHASNDKFDSLLEELKSVHEHVQDHISLLEAVTSRARQRQRWPPVHSPIQIRNSAGETVVVANAQGREMKGVAKASEEVEAKVRGYGNMFDCNICLKMARNLVVTCCGHLFCWPCYYH